MSQIITNETIHDDVYVAIDNEFEQIRTSLGMYISKLGTEGALHLIKEDVNNEFDEAVNPEALNRTFDIIFDEIEQSFSTVDRSRGIPFELMKDVCMKKHTSTKFVREADKMKDQAGRNGVGLVVIAACSKYFSMTSYRGDKSKTIEFIDGKLKDHKPIKLKKPQHGLALKFIPSSEYLKGEVNLETHQIQDYLRRMSYIMREDIKINYYEFSREMSDKDYGKGKPSFTHTYKRLGLSENVKFISQNIEFAPIVISAISEDFDLEMAFSYDKTIDETIINSYCNYINTTEGGNHETVAQRAICDFFCREAKKLDPNAKYEVTYDDCRKGLILCVNCKHKDPAFEGQHKSRVSNSDVLKDGKRYLMKELYNFFGANNALMRRIIAYLRTIAKIRLEAHKIKGITQKKQTSFLDDGEIPMWYPIADRNYTGYTEIIVAEGNSAASAINGARNNKYQAIFGVMGVVKNVYGMSSMQIMTGVKVFARFVNLLGCGIGADFDISKLRYDKIILMCDADADGGFIDSLMLLMIAQNMPELIIQGKVYKALPPLLILNMKAISKWYKGSPYCYNKEDYYEVINKIIADNSEIAIEINEKNVVKNLKKKDYMKWLKMNAEYTTELKQLNARTACRTDILEYVCYAKVVCANDKTEKRFKKMIESEFPEMNYLPDHTFTGSVDGESVTLVIDDIFWSSTKRFMKVLVNNPSIYIHIKNKNEKSDRYERTTIGRFLFDMENMYTVKILQRYKGIGEMDVEVIFNTALNPKLRKLIRFTMDDVEDTMKMFSVMHGKKAEMRELRRQLLVDNPISYMDLDN